MRIVAGKYKGVVLNTFDYENIRPTSDKVREAVFSKIQFQIQESVWLDLFSGTGAISLEAISRGAKQVVVCDESSDSCKLIEKNYAKCKLKPELLKLNFIKSLNYLEQKNYKFDFIFLDPPFATNYGAKAIKLINQKDLLDREGLIIFERSRDMSLYDIPDIFEVFDTKNYGTISVDFIKYRK